LDLFLGQFFDPLVFRVVESFIDFSIGSFELFDEGLEGTEDLLLFEFFPGELLKPGMIFEFVDSVETESIFVLPQQKLIAENESLIGPLGDTYMGPLQSELFLLENLSSLASCTDLVGSLTDDALVHDDPKGVKVDLEGMVLSLKNLGSHVGGSAGGVALVVDLPRLGDSKVGNLSIAFIIKDDVLWFDVPVNDPVLMDLL
jgi:hypothetical protein